MAEIGAALVEIAWRAAGALVVGTIFFGCFLLVIAMIALGRTPHDH